MLEGHPRRGQGRGRGLDAGQRPQAVERQVHAPPQGLEVRGLSPVPRDAERQHAVRLEAGRHALQRVEAPEEQSRSEQQGHRQRHLDADQQPLEPVRGGRVRAGPGRERSGKVFGSVIAKQGKRRKRLCILDVEIRFAIQAELDASN